MCPPQGDQLIRPDIQGKDPKLGRSPDVGPLGLRIITDRSLRGGSCRCESGGWSGVAWRRQSDREQW